MNWLVADWRGLLPEGWAQVVLALGAVLAGAVIGSEREKRDKPAGLRTLILVCLGSATFTMVSFAFGTTTGDTGRVAAQIVSGIGFLGAGVILHGRTAVSGVTTAATIWAAAGIGVVAGVGYVPGALGLSLLVRVVLSAVYWWEQRFIGELKRVDVEIIADDNYGKTRFKLERLLSEYNVSDNANDIPAPKHDLLRVRLNSQLPRRQRLELLDELARLPEVREIRTLE